MTILQTNMTFDHGTFHWRFTNGKAFHLWLPPWMVYWSRPWAAKISGLIWRWSWNWNHLNIDFFPGWFVQRIPWKNAGSVTFSSFSLTSSSGPRSIWKVSSQCHLRMRVLHFETNQSMICFHSSDQSMIHWWLMFWWFYCFTISR